MHNGPNAKDEYEMPFLETPCLILIFGAKMNKIVTPAQNIQFNVMVSISPQFSTSMFSMFFPSQSPIRPCWLKDGRGRDAVAEMQGRLSSIIFY